jgi:hypothetical protein
LSKVGIDFGVINCEVRGYLSDIHRKNYVRDIRVSIWNEYEATVVAPTLGMPVGREKRRISGPCIWDASLPAASLPMMTEMQMQDRQLSVPQSGIYVRAKSEPEV